MTENTLGPFFTHVLEICQKRVEEDFGSSDIIKGSSPLEVIEQYHHLLAKNRSFQLEKILMNDLKASDFAEIGLTKYYPRIYRGLTRLYHRDHPSQSIIDPKFTHLPSLKKHAVMKALFSTYSSHSPQGKMAVFTWVNDHYLGNYYTALETMLLLKGRFPELDVELIVIAPSQIANGLFGAVPYDESSDVMPENVHASLRKKDFVLQIPSLYKYLDLPATETVGQCGSIELSSFEPKSSNFSMGLHFLEKGILTRKLRNMSWSDIKNIELNQWRDFNCHFYFADLSTSMGATIYLHALLKSLEGDERGIDLVIPNLTPILEYIEKRRESNPSIFEWDLGVSSIEIQYSGKVCYIPISDNGKIVRIISPKKIIHSDFQTLLLLSGDFVSVSNLQSLSEILLLEKPFFYDGDLSALSFIKDILALAENRIGEYRYAMSCIQGMFKALINQIRPSDELWVDETFFQERVEWTSIAMDIGLSLQEGDAAIGFKKLSRIFSSEFSCNNFLCHLVQRAFCHLQFPHKAQEEKDLVSQFINGALSFKSLIQNVL